MTTFLVFFFYHFFFSISVNIKMSHGGEANLVNTLSGKRDLFYLYFNTATVEVELTKAMNYGVNLLRID